MVLTHRATGGIGPMGLHGGKRWNLACGDSALLWSGKSFFPHIEGRFVFRQRDSVDNWAFLARSE